MSIPLKEIPFNFPYNIESGTSNKSERKAPFVPKVDLSFLLESNFPSLDSPTSAEHVKLCGDRYLTPLNTSILADALEIPLLNPSILQNSMELIPDPSAFQPKLRTARSLKLPTTTHSPFMELRSVKLLPSPSFPLSPSTGLRSVKLLPLPAFPLSPSTELRSVQDLQLSTTPKSTLTELRSFRPTQLAISPQSPSRKRLREPSAELLRIAELGRKEIRSGAIPDVRSRTDSDVSSASEEGEIKLWAAMELEENPLRSNPSAIPKSNSQPFALDPSLHARSTLRDTFNFLSNSSVPTSSSYLSSSSDSSAVTTFSLIPPPLLNGSSTTSGSMHLNYLTPRLKKSRSTEVFQPYSPFCDSVGSPIKRVMHVGGLQTVSSDEKGELTIDGKVYNVQKINQGDFHWVFKFKTKSIIQIGDIIFNTKDVVFRKFVLKRKCHNKEDVTKEKIVRRNEMKALKKYQLIDIPIPKVYVHPEMFSDPKSSLSGNWIIEKMKSEITCEGWEDPKLEYKNLSKEDKEVLDFAKKYLTLESQTGSPVISDFYPRNLMRDRKGAIKVVDFDFSDESDLREELKGWSNGNQNIWEYLISDFSEKHKAEYPFNLKEYSS